MIGSIWAVDTWMKEQNPNADQGVD